VKVIQGQACYDHWKADKILHNAAQ